MTEEIKIESKPIWKSKTFWSSLVVALAPLAPGTSEWISGNPEAYSAILGAMFMFLRTITSNKVTIDMP